MSKTELNEKRAIIQLMERDCSTGYSRAVKENLPVTYVSGTEVVSEHNGQRTVIAHVQPATRLQTPKTYYLK